MKYPSGAKYQESMQNPKLALPPALHAYTPDTNQLGMVALWSGGNAATFRMVQGSRSLALRCFTRYVDDREQRLKEIAKFLRNQPTPPFMPIDFIPNGILLPDGTRYPIVHMPWVQGEPLHKYIDSQIGRGASFTALIDQFKQIIDKLATLQIAHGDLQHGNIMVSNGQLILIDYDGMYLPQLAGLRNPESGHEHYQHPERNDEFNADLDRFSSIVIYLALQALNQKPTLWYKFSVGGENLLFKKPDFLNPDKSPLLIELQSISNIAPLVNHFRAICKGSLTQVPTLQDLLSGKSITIVPNSNRPIARRASQFPIFPATDRTSLLQNLGERVVVIGKITDIHKATDRNGNPYAFINLGNYRTGCLTLVLWSYALKNFQKKAVDPSSFAGKWVSITGVLSSYKADYLPTRPQIEIETPIEIEVLSGEAEAKERLMENDLIPTQPSPPTLRSPSTDRSTTEETLTKLYSATAPRPPSTPTNHTTQQPAQPPANHITQRPTTTTPASGPQSRPQMPQAAPPLFDIATDIIDFGTVFPGQPASQQLRLTNTSNKLLDFATAHLVSWVTCRPRQIRLSPGESIQISLQLQVDQIPSHAFSNPQRLPTHFQYQVSSSVMQIYAPTYSRIVFARATIQVPIAPSQATAPASRLQPASPATTVTVPAPSTKASPVSAQNASIPAAKVPPYNMPPSQPVASKPQFHIPEPIRALLLGIVLMLITWTVIGLIIMLISTAS